ncbi:MAG: hypothetical protein ABL909_11450 [Sphingopyxis sp.]
MANRKITIECTPQNLDWIGILLKVYGESKVRAVQIVNGTGTAIVPDGVGCSITASAKGIVGQAVRIAVKVGDGSFPPAEQVQVDAPLVFYIPFTIPPTI